ncbi:MULTISPECIES: type II secretion system F family protein [unclassified Frigoribacterium]|jgi:type IV pilus assembly protein PilC|uniref:type II secretion system F family protein n=1 Tax=unclassified Frigoribacterium TaxID=2627005 RepID=UPI0006F49E01|nr:MULTISPECIES: type II secretion system F family protein [unclassified Frigoribacterium]KQM29394.1 pilus assembly protein PilC [Frigoribacterium sp. Leaf8]MBD8139558.1 type II secretion system F family protein [Frigoribacterium sp. CFBP 13605]MBD8484828.1 type II secretion system F family protein [Frigoribacterium sp. CFBP 8759]NQW87889.1 type II secretion system F family protein [Frigoribacterium sp. VKM Ac-2860]NQX09302.1 type II secretion system F family protein [Frigoribacterium sp. VKM 
MAGAVAYAYKGRDGAGKVVKGKVDASSEGAVITRLRTMGVQPISISEAGAGTGLQREVSIPGLGDRAVKMKDIAVMSRQMATMIGSGLSLLRTLTILADQVDNKRLAKIMAEVRDDVETGVSFSDAVGKHDKDFPPLMINMIKAGETGGFLDKALESTAENFEKEVALRSTIKSAMTYPVVVLVMSLVAVVIMLLFIVPIFQDMFTNLGGQLPLPTMMLVYASRAMPYVVPAGIVVGIAFSIWWRTNKNSVKVRAFLDPLKLKLPVFGALFRKIAIARFSRNFSNMIGAGVPILTALRIVGEVSGNYVLEEALVKVAESVRQGESIAGPLTESGVFPSMVTQMISVGEDSGSLQTMLEKVADFYDQEVKSTTESLTALIEPLLIAFLGVVVGGMIVALYLPIFQITSLIK